MGSDAAPGNSRINEIDDLGAKIIGYFFESALKVGLKPHDNERGILPIVADLTTTDETVWRRCVGVRKTGNIKSVFWGEEGEQSQ